MLSRLNPKRADAHDLDVVVLPPPAEESTKPAPEATPSTENVPLRTAPDFAAERPVPPIGATVHPAAADTIRIERPAEHPGETHVEHPVEHQASIRLPNDRPRSGGFIRRMLTALVMVFVGVGATFGWQSYGDAARQIAAKWAARVPLASLASWPPTKSKAVAEPASEAPVQAAEAAQAPQPAAPQPVAQPIASPAPQPAVAQQVASQDPAPQQPAPPAPVAPEAVAPAPVVIPPELTQSLQAMAHDLGTLKQGLEQLKANQEQMTRDIAKLTEQDARRRAQAALPRPLPATRRPAPMYPPPQAAAQQRYAPPPPQVAMPPRPAPLPPPPVAQPPVQQPQVSSVPRPPAPVSP